MHDVFLLNCIIGKMKKKIVYFVKCKYERDTIYYQEQVTGLVARNFLLKDNVQVVSDVISHCGVFI